MNNRLTQKDKWEMFKQFMHNELGITKEDIRGWINESIKDETKKLMHQSFGVFDPKEIAKKTIREELQDILKDAPYDATFKNIIMRYVAQELINKYELTDKKE